MLKGTTESGFEFEIDESRIRKMEFLENLADLDDGNPLALPRLVKQLFDTEDKKRLYEHCDHDTEKVTQEIYAIFRANGETKNS
jgi:hypothetical protein